MPLNRPLITSADKPLPTARQPLTAKRAASGSALRERTTVLAALVVLLAICFGKPLFALVQFARHSELYSHVLRIPFISAYLVWLKRRDLKLDGKQVSRWALLPLVGGATLLSAYWFWLRSGWKPSETDYLAVMILAFLLFG